MDTKAAKEDSKQACSQAGFGRKILGRSRGSKACLRTAGVAEQCAFLQRGAAGVAFVRDIIVGQLCTAACAEGVAGLNLCRAGGTKSGSVFRLKLRAAVGAENAFRLNLCYADGADLGCAYGSDRVAAFAADLVGWLQGVSAEFTKHR